MTNNSKLVQYFVKEYLGQNVDKLVNIVSPSFTYVLNHRTSINFDQFTARMRAYTRATLINIGEISSGDDIHFHYDFEIKLPNGKVLVIEENPKCYNPARSLISKNCDTLTKNVC